MTALPFTGSGRRRAPAAGPPAPLRRAHPSRAAQLRPATPAEPLEPRTLLATFVVTTTADSGPGSLRQAILDANAHGNPLPWRVPPDEIHFDLPGAPGATHTIQPRTPLPAITDALVVNGMTQPGYEDTPLIELDGSAAGPEADGLVIRASETTVKGLAINRFARHGVVASHPRSTIGNEPYITITDCRIGTDASGEVALGNGGAGVLITEGRAWVGGATAFGPSNVISANGLAGVWVRGGTAHPNAFVAIGGNAIGTNTAGTRALGNGAEGVLVESTMNVGVGAFHPRPATPHSPLPFGNFISGNSSSGVRVVGPTGPRGVGIGGNWIGIGASGTTPIANGASTASPHRDGVTVTGDATVQIAWNTIGGNARDGIRVDAPGDPLRRAQVEANSNFIGIDAFGSGRLGNGRHGVTATGNCSLRLHANQIGANAGSGVFGQGDPRVELNVTLSGNLIGTNGDGSPIGNGAHGVELRGVGDSVIGGPNVLYRGENVPAVFIPPIPPGTFQNVISANAGHGILIAGDAQRSTPPTILVQNNYIGTDRKAELTLGNGGSGIYLEGTLGVVVGGTHRVTEPGEYQGRVFDVGNLITASRADGVTVSAPGERNRIERNSIFSNGGLGIDLLPGEGVTPNDAGDADAGANRLQNYPIVTGVTPDRDGRVSIGVTLHAERRRTYRVDLFLNAARDPSGHGEGERFFGSLVVTTDASGNAVGGFNAPAPAVALRRWLTATATDPAGNTSEFSPAASTSRARAMYRPVARPPARAAPSSLAAALVAFTNHGDPQDLLH